RVLACHVRLAVGRSHRDASRLADRLIRPTDATDYQPQRLRRNPVTTLVIEQFAAPDSVRAIRRLELTRRRAAEELAGRTVWCVSSVRAGRRAADALRRRLRMLPADGLASRAIRIREGQTLTRVTENGDELLGSEVQAGDVVVLHDPIAAALADAVRARDAHAIWWLSVERLDDTADDTWALADCTRPRVDAYLTAWQRRGPSGA